jgi:hypothetical protein
VDALGSVAFGACLAFCSGFFGFWCGFLEQKLS